MSNPSRQGTRKRPAQPFQRHLIQAACLVALQALTVSAAWSQTKPNTQVETVSSSATTTVLRIYVPKPVLETVDTPEGKFQRFSAREGGFGVDNSQTGLPELPLSGFSLALPLDGDGKPLVNIEPEGSLQRIQARIYPVQPPEHARVGEEDSEKERFVFDKALYAKGVKTPGQALGSLSLAKSDVNVEGYRLAPYGYQPESQIITYYPSYLITIRHPGKCFTYDRLLNREWLSTRQDKGIDSVDQRIEAIPQPAVQFAINRNIAQELRCVPPKLVFNPNLLGARFLIVTHPNFVDAANELKAHKVALGISTRVVTTAEITGGIGAASKTQIRNWIASYYNSHLVRPKWVMFMGDAEYIPTSYDEVSPFFTDPDFPEYARTAGDMWYGQFQPGDDANTVPPFGIGRLPVDTLAQANTIVSKVKAYELFPPANPLFGKDFYNSLTFASHFQADATGQTDKRWFVETSEIVRNHLKAQGYNVARNYWAPAGSNPRFYNSGTAIPAELRKPAFPWNAGPTDVANSINAGSALVYHRDHGWWDGWSHPGFSTSNLSSVSVTGNQFPVVFSINCASGIFDNETVDLPAHRVAPGYGPSVSGVNFSEAFLRKSDGALAVIGDTRISSTTANNHMTLGLFDAVFTGLLPYGTSTPIKRLGDILNYAKIYIKDVASGSAANSHPLKADGTRPGVATLRHELNIYNLLGDPTVKLRVSPQNLVSFPFAISSIVLKGNIAQVAIKRGEGALAEGDWLTAVAVDPKSGEELGRGVINEDGTADIDLGDAQPRNVVVRVSTTEGMTAQAAAIESDTDGDRVPDSRDNCIDVKNTDQKDSDSDGYGNACDADANNDGLVNSIDVSIIRAAFDTTNARADLNGDGTVNSIDVALVRKLFATRPGPSAWHRSGR